MSKPPRISATWITSVHRVDHLVTQTEQAASIRRGDGMLRALCGEYFAVAPMVADPGECCRACVVRTVPVPRPRPPRRGPLAALLDQLTPRTPAGACAPDHAPAGSHRRAS